MPSEAHVDRTPLVIIAIALLTLVSCSNPAQAEIDRGDALLTANKVDEAFAAYDAALAIDPDDPAALAGRGCARSPADQELAMTDLDRAIELDPTSYSGHRCRAELHRASGDLDAALADATKAIELDPARAYGHVTLGNILDEQGRTAEAIASYDKAIELEPTLANAYNQRSIARSRSGDDDGAAVDVDKAIELDPDYGPAYAVRALARFFEGDCARGMADAEKAVQLEPDFPGGYSARAMCRGQAQDLDGALERRRQGDRPRPGRFLRLLLEEPDPPRSRLGDGGQGRPATRTRVGSHTRSRRRGPCTVGGIRSYVAL